MAVVFSYGQLQQSDGPRALANVDLRGTSSGGFTAYTDGDPYVYAAMYRTQPNVRTVVDFLARNIAQVPLHAYRRVSDIDRQRVSDHEVIRWLDHPNPGTTRYRLFESLIQDLGIYFNAYWLKVTRGDGGVGLVRLPPEQMTVEGWLIPDLFVWTLDDGRRVELPRESVVYFNGYDPSNPLMGLSPLETLRQVLAEDCAQTNYRRAYWQNAARLEGVITRPKDAPKWNLEQKQAFREQWVARFGGQAGQTAVLEDGMTFTPISFSARDSEFVAARKLTREEVAAAYHVPQPMVGILDHATYSNIKEQHKQLYQDCLGPWFEMIQEEIERQLLVDARDVDRIYLEFNFADKMKGAFEEQAGAVYTLVGRPIMTANEGRARLNLPRITDDPTADELALPLNTSTGSAVAFSENGPEAALPPADVPDDTDPEEAVA